MEQETKREKFIFWLIQNSERPWLWVVTIISASVLTNTGWPILIGLGLVLIGSVAFAAGVHIALDSMDNNYVVQKYKEKEKKNDAS